MRKRGVSRACRKKQEAEEEYFAQGVYECKNYKLTELFGMDRSILCKAVTQEDKYKCYLTFEATGP